MGMDVKELRAFRRYLYEQNKKFGHVLSEVPREQWPEKAFDSKRVRVLRSRTHMDQVFDEGRFFRLSICRTELDDDGRWKDGMTWDELQRLKKEAGYGDKFAFEVFPADACLVNVANMRHLWVDIGGEMNIGWRRTDDR